MSCLDFERRLEALLEGKLSPHDRDRCQRHAAACAACLELLRLAIGAGDTDPRLDLTPAILSRTSGSSCGAARTRLPSYVDGELADGDRELVVGHLNGCPECRAVGRRLETLTAELPRLANLYPGPGFVDAVLARTLSPTIRLRRRWQSTWSQWVHRPRFALEVAYVGALALMAVTAIGSPPLIGDATTVRAGVGTEVVALREPVASTVDAIRTSGALVSEAARRAGEIGGDLAVGLGTLGPRVASLLEKPDDSPTGQEASE